VAAAGVVELVKARIAAVLLACFAMAAGAESPEWQEVFYSSADLRIQAYLYRPQGDGPFPAVIYNHGSRPGRERVGAPFEFVGRALARAGYVVLVPERRGYGRSDGATWSEEVGNDHGRYFVERLEKETGDVVAALDYLRGLAFVDAGHIGVMGWSLGGIVTMFAIARTDGFAAAVNQAGGALSWDGNAQLRAALRTAAEKSSTPVLLLVAANDRTTASVTTLADILRKRGVAHRLVIYDAFARSGGDPRIAPGHAIFSAQGLANWEGDVLDFFGRYLAPPP
jgi:carboxymethylenebutenolidase